MVTAVANGNRSHFMAHGIREHKGTLTYGFVCPLSMDKETRRLILHTTKLSAKRNAGATIDRNNPFSHPCRSESNISTLKSRTDSLWMTSQRSTSFPSPSSSNLNCNETSLWTSEVSTVELSVCHVEYVVCRLALPCTIIPWPLWCQLDG
jgi:hypothetical protein